MMILWEQRDKLQTMIVIALAVLAWWRGAGPERASALVLVAMVAVLWTYKLLALPTQELMARLFGTVDALFLATDGLALVALTVIALRANRFYPILLAGCQLVSLMTHLASGMLRTEFPFAYALFNILPFYCMIAVLAGGLIAHLRRKRRLGQYPSWRGFSDHLLPPIPKRPRPPTR